MGSIHSLPPGVDFPAELVAGLRARLAGQPPEAMARVRLYVNTQRMRRRIVELMSAEGAAFLPRIRLVSELGDEVAIPGLPPAVPPLRRRLELTRLVGRLLDAQPDLAPKSALYDLADSLAGLMDEMQGEGVAPERIAGLDVSAHSAHWARTQAFLGIVAPFFGPAAPPDAEARRRMVVERLAELWAAHPPEGPVIVAGSTGSRGTTALFMQAVMRLPQGALVLPGFDHDMPARVWPALDHQLTAEDHPQYRFRHLLRLMEVDPADVTPWAAVAAPDPDRNRLISLSLRPAPVTDQWLVEGQHLPDLVAATEGLTLVEAQSPRAEALAVALILRRAAEEGQRAALITPDRMLTRQVAAALDRWGIVPDDSAGVPLQQTPPGRFLRLVLRLMGARLTPETLLTVLKHPMAGTGAARGDHLRLTRDLELELRRNGPAFPDGATLMAWAVKRKDEAAGPWAAALALAIEGLDQAGEAPLAEHIARHRALGEAFARGAGDGTGELWEKEAGRKALALFDTLVAEAEHGGSFTVAAYRDLFDALISREEVRSSTEPHPGVMIWGTLEARVSGAELVILSGLNDGVWPGMADPDPWLNRAMRKEAGLLLPERQIGLAAHDYQQAIAAPQVVITRAARDADAETVPSRWLNRLTNLMEGLPARRGPDALAAMRSRGRQWLQLAHALDLPPDSMQADPRMRRADRPAPRPPLAVRPARLPLTRIATLIRDPYAIYAREVLGLRPLDPLRHAPDARIRGNAVHLILETFVKQRPEVETRPEARARLMATAAAVLEEEVPWPAARLLWLARLNRAADHFLRFDAEQGGTTLLLEDRGSIMVDPLDFQLFGIPDRIDEMADGRLHLIDYKTGSPPTEAQQRAYDKQLILAAAMAERGGFKPLGMRDVARISYLGLGAGEKLVQTEITPDLTLKAWEGLVKLLTRYASRDQGYVARRAVFEDRFAGDYDHLARHGEWQMSDRAVAVTVGPADE